MLGGLLALVSAALAGVLGGVLALGSPVGIALLAPLLGPAAFLGLPLALPLGPGGFLLPALAFLFLGALFLLFLTLCRFLGLFGLAGLLLRVVAAGGAGRLVDGNISAALLAVCHRDSPLSVSFISGQLL